VSLLQDLHERFSVVALRDILPGVAVNGVEMAYTTAIFDRAVCGGAALFYGTSASTFTSAVWSLVSRAGGRGYSTAGGELPHKHGDYAASTQLRKPSHQNQRDPANTRRVRAYAELSLQVMEEQRLREAAALAKSRGYSIKGFYHTSNIRSAWKHIVREQLRILGGYRQEAEAVQEHELSSEPEPSKWGLETWASLLEYSTSLDVIVAARHRHVSEEFEVFIDSLDLPHRAKVSVTFAPSFDRDTVDSMSLHERSRMRARYPSASAGEIPTFQAAFEYCRTEVVRPTHYVCRVLGRADQPTSACCAPAPACRVV